LVLALQKTIMSVKGMSFSIEQFIKKRLSRAFL
jgi:hypothetical protein